MARIRLLDEDTINKIAAGEVIERPASVVKELVENSIDANAGRILIEVEDGGKSFIKITDDGCGMEAEDLILAFQKHATSKIRDAGDLERIATLGFRGEALASIASVSAAIEVRTKTRDSLSGTYLRLENGKIAETKEIGCPVGTSITVWDLFHNVPARKKHLKGAEAELVHITDVVTEAGHRPLRYRFRSLYRQTHPIQVRKISQLGRRAPAPLRSEDSAGHGRSAGRGPGLEHHRSGRRRVEPQEQS